MKLKPVVASVVMLGLMAPAFAAKPLAKKRTALAQQAVINQNSVISPACSKGWFNRITVSGKASIIGAIGSHSAVGMFQENNSSTDAFVNNFNVILDAKLSTWSKATLNMAYLGAPNPFHYPSVEENTTVDDGVGNRHIRHAIVADEAYVTIGNIRRNPFYLIFGKKYVPFGDYKDPYVPYGMMSPAQMMSQFNAVTGILGVSSDFGLYASIFGFRGESGPVGSKSENIRNFGGKIGYYDTLDQFDSPRTHVNFALSYIHNLWDSQVFSKNADTQWQWFSTNVSGGNFKVNHPANYKGEIEPIGGISLHGDLAYKDFSVSANYVSAMTDMIQDSTGYNVKGSNRSRLWGADVGGDYSFKSFKRNSSLGIGAQFSGNGAWIGDNTSGLTDWVRIFPRWRLLAEYKINLFKNTDLSLVATHGKSYDFKTAGSTDKNRSPGDPAEGSNKTVSTGYARLNVQF